MPAMMLARPSSILFDLDGTLVNSVTDLTRSCNAMRRQMGMGERPLDELASFIGDGARMLVLRALDHREDLVDEGLRRFRSHYAEHLLDNTVAYPGVEATLAELHGVPMAVVTNKPHPMATAILDGLGLSRHFGAIVGARSGVPVKPATDLLKLALSQLGVDDGVVWMVGDSRNDILSGRALGAVTVAVTYGIGSLESIQEAGPDVSIGSFDGLTGKCLT